MVFAFKLSRRLAQNFCVTALAAAVLAACAGERSPIDPHPAASVSSITITPPRASLAVNETVELYVTLRDSSGDPLDGGGRPITWTSAASGVATVSASGVVAGVSPGSATIRAAAEGKEDSAVVTVLAAGGSGGGGEEPTEHGGYHVAPDGTSGGDGSADNPWSLPTALAGAGGRVQPGDTVWLHGGTYTGSFRTTVSGTAGHLVVFRQYPGERATIDGTLRVDGHDVAVWGLEIMRSAPSGALPGLETRGARQKFINLVIHDAAQQGITFWDESVDSEMYGCIVYNNGTHENLDHGTYVHNNGGTKLIRDNVFFNNLAYGIHVYAGPGAATQRNVHLVGNVAFNNGTIATRYAAKGNIIIGAEVADEGMRATDNLLYLSGSAGENLRIGYRAANRDVVVSGNTVWGGSIAFVMGDWSNAVVQN
ncbi:MAG: Ig-like domain-containing protein, partial [Gemmatimonadales bacterium]